MSRHRRFGAAIMEIDGLFPRHLAGYSPARNLERPPAPTGDYRIRLRCFDIHQMRSTISTSISNAVKRRFPFGAAKLHCRVSQCDERIAVRISIASIGRGELFDPSSRSERKYFEFKFAIAIPGLRRIYTKNSHLSGAAGNWM